jgi:hypothetical protein
MTLMTTSGRVEATSGRMARGRATAARFRLVLLIDGAEYQVRPFMEDYSGKSMNEAENLLTGPDGVEFSVYWRQGRSGEGWKMTCSKCDSHRCVHARAVVAVELF